LYDLTLTIKKQAIVKMTPNIIMLLWLPKAISHNTRNNEATKIPIIAVSNKEIA
jgi:hypothetical protein